MKDIKGYEGLYAVTEDGNVWSYYRKRYMKPTADAKGYLRVDLYKDGKKKNYKVHRLIAETYIDNPNNLPQVNHKDENKENNSISNLEWCDTAYNLNYGSYPSNMADKLKGNCYAGRKVECIETGVIYKSMLEASRQTGINNASISHTLNGWAKTAGGFHWRYANE